MLKPRIPPTANPVLAQNKEPVMEIDVPHPATFAAGGKAVTCVAPGFGFGHDLVEVPGMMLHRPLLAISSKDSAIELLQVSSGTPLVHISGVNLSARPISTPAPPPQLSAPL